MMYRSGRRIVALACLAAGFASPAAAQLFWKSPDFKGAPIQGDEANVLIPLPGATPAERDAGIVWTLRAGLNVAALQCQFANSLGTVANYNAILTHHSKELNTDYKALEGYFKRTAAKGAKLAAMQSALDQYTTRTYNSFSTLRAQYGYCQTAGSIGEDALMHPKGTLLLVAKTRLREFRNSLVPTGEYLVAPGQTTIAAGTDVPGYAPECFDRKGQLKKKCLKD
ncbi:MAG: hypothetical protein JWO65_424 [Sphingomonas bacterium]|nr:hypothetical protein [Sphingomonas bacterium]